MNEINFLPESFVRMRRAKKRVMREILLVAFVAMGMAAWFTLERRTLGELTAHAEALELQSSQATQDDETLELQAKYNNLARQHVANRQMVCPVSSPQLLATIASLTPPQVALRSLELKDKGLTAWMAWSQEQKRLKELAESNKGKSKRSKGAQRKPNPSTAVSPLLVVQVQAVAPSDVEITDFVGRITQHPLFDNVKLHYTRSTTVGDYSARGFSLEMNVRLDRLYSPTAEAEPTQEVANAD